MKKLIMTILILATVLLSQSGCAGEKVFIDGKYYSAHRINQKPSVSY
jgi:hypothetical protein